MILPDVNVLVYAHRPDAEDHLRYRNWLDAALKSRTTCGLADLVLSSVIRIVTNPRIFARPTPVDIAFQFADSLRELPSTVRVSPGDRHWGIFRSLCGKAATKGNLVSDAYLAALAIEFGAELITADQDYAKFPELRWRHPFS